MGRDQADGERRRTLPAWDPPTNGSAPRHDPPRARLARATLLRPRPKRPSKLDPLHADIEGLLDDDEALSGVRIRGEIEKLGYDGGIAPSTGAVGSAYDCDGRVVLGADASRALQPQTLEDRIELATAIHDYIELFHNTKRRHSSLNMLTLAEYEDQYQQINQPTSIAA